MFLCEKHQQISSGKSKLCQTRVFLFGFRETLFIGTGVRVMNKPCQGQGGGMSEKSPVRTGQRGRVGAGSGSQANNCLGVGGGYFPRTKKTNRSLFVNLSAISDPPGEGVQNKWILTGEGGILMGPILESQIRDPTLFQWFKLKTEGTPPPGLWGS